MLCLIAVLCIPGYSQYEVLVSGPNGLVTASSDVQNSPNAGSHSVRFDYYGDVGTFRIDSPTNKVESLIFERSSSDSDGVLKVTGTLLDIKSTKAKVTLKGLAFQLMPNAVLISGSDGSKVNGSLLIDSCFIFADTLENTFLSWLGDNLSSVVISNSYIVVGGSRNATAKISLSGGTLKLNNNLINFPGILSSPGVFKEAEFISNTINRTQFQLTGLLNAGALPRLEFSKNLVAHKGAKDAFGGNVFYVLNHSNFQSGRVSIQSNKMFKTWTGFDYPSNEIFRISPNDTIDTIPGKASSEKWNWYTETLDGNQTGMLSGAIPLVKYNVLPQETGFSWPTSRGVLTAQFQPAPYPRMISLGNPANTYTLPADSAYLRRIYPPTGTLHFGPFRISQITLGAAADYGKPALLALSNDTLRTQTINTAVKSNPSIFVNGLGESRNFVLVHSGNTPSGLLIRPGEGSELSANDKILFSMVDSAGTTVVKAPAAQNLAKDLRSLSANFRVETNAVINSLVHVGIRGYATPYLPDSVYWLFRNPSDSLVRAVKSGVIPDTGMFTASYPYSSSRGLLDAHLVEKLSVPAGGKTIPVTDGTIRLHSPQGFQLKVDSSHVVDTLVYGSVTKGYSFTWPLKSPTDSVILLLKKKPEQELFVKVRNLAPDTLKGMLDTAGNFRIVVAPVDTGKIFFAGVPYNVVKGNPGYTKTFPDGVNLTDFASSTSGKLLYDSTLDADKRESLNAVVKVYRYLGGRQMRAISAATIKPSRPYGMSFAISGPRNASKIEVYIHDGENWLPSPHPGNYTGSPIGIPLVPIEARAVAVVERLESATTYVDSLTPQVVGTILTVTPTYRIDALKLISHYCVELMVINTAGSVTTDTCTDKDKVAIGQTTTKTLLYAAYQIRFKFYMGVEPIDGLDFEPLKNYGFNLEQIVAEIPDVATKVRKQWSLIGFPVAGSFSKIMMKQEFPANHPDSLRKRDTTLVLRVQKDPLEVAKGSLFDTVKAWSALEVKRGDAYLLASSHDFKTVVQNDFGAQMVEPDTLELDTGWNLISNPFPTNMLVSKIRTSPPRQGLTFYGLDVIQSGDKRTYGWKTESALRAFIGYAFYAQPGEKLVFNLLADTSGALAKSGTGVSAPEMEARLISPWGVSSMSITSIPGRISIPFLPAPGAGPQLRVGGGAGYMIKAVTRQDRIDEPMEIRSGTNGSIAFTLTRPFQAGISMRLIDLETGEVIDEEGARALTLSQGTRRYRLLAGDAAFLESRIQAFKAAVPAEIGLSQNFPNPFRGRTHVELRWPAWDGGDRTGTLHVMDMHGRTVKRMDLGKILVGKQVVTLDASQWQSGVYLYRLDVTAGSRRFHLQKRMLVTR